VWLWVKAAAQSISISKHELIPQARNLSPLHVHVTAATSGRQNAIVKTQLWKYHGLGAVASCPPSQHQRSQAVPLGNGQDLPSPVAQHTYGTHTHKTASPPR